MVEKFFEVLCFIEPYERFLMVKKFFEVLCKSRSIWSALDREYGTLWIRYAPGGRTHKDRLTVKHERISIAYL